jgi:hypothetical protein
MSIVRTFTLQFYLNTLFMNKVGECYLPSILRRQYFSIIFNDKSANYTQLNTVVIVKRTDFFSHLNVMKVL